MRDNAVVYLPAVVLFILISVASYTLMGLSTVNNVIDAMAPTPPYSYSLNISVKPIAVYALSPQEVFLVGTVNGSTVIEVLNVSNPFSPPKVLQSYPLVGSPTAIVTNGYPITRIAVGTNAGDLVLFKVNGGRIYLLLHAVLGTDFAIKKLLVLKGSNDYKLAVLAAEGKSSTGGVCTRCHVYVFDELSGGALRIGANEGNATLAINNVLPQDISAALIINKGQYYYDAQKFVVTWLPAKFYVILVNATYTSGNATLKPASYALVDIVTYSKVLREMYHYGINLGKDGTAEIPVPWGFDANLTITDTNGKKYFEHISSPNASEVTKVYASFNLNSSPITVKASSLYKTPSYELAIPHIINVNNAPDSFASVTSLNDTQINPASTGLSLLKGSSSSNFILYYYDPSSGKSHIKVYTSSFKPLSEVIDYVGTGLHSLGAFTYPDEKIIITAYREGKTKYYIETEGSYKFFYELSLGGFLNKVDVIPSTEGYYYIAYTTTGLQIVRTYPYQVPVLRYGTQINYASGSISGDIGGNLNYGVVAYSNHLVILQNIAQLLMQGKPTNLDVIKAPRLYLRITLPKGLPIKGTHVYLLYPGGILEKTLETSNNVVFPNIIPYERYTLIVNYSKPFVNKVSLNITPTEYKDIHVNVNLTYKTYLLTLNIKDSLSGTRIIAPYDILIDNKTIIKNLRNSTVTFPIVYGNHTITVKPAEGYENIYGASTVHVYVTNNTSVNVVLQRKRYLLSVVVMDKYSKHLLAPIVVEVNKTTSKIIGFGATKATFILPYGNYTIHIYPPKEYSNIYVPTTTKITLSKPSTITIVLERIKYPVNITVKDAIDNASPIVPLNIMVDGKIVVKALRNTSVTIPMIYGNHTVTAFPVKDYENAYEPRSVRVSVTRNTTASIYLQRKRYLLSVVVMDKYSKHLLAPIVVEVNKTTSKIIGFGATKATFILPYGNYTIHIYPPKEYSNIYVPTTTKITLSKPSTITIVLERARYTLDISIKDITTGTIAGLFNVYVNGSKVATGIRSGTHVTLPYGIYSVAVTPEPKYTSVYSTPHPQIVKLFKNASITFKLTRKIYKIKIMVVDDVGAPIKNAEVKFFSIDKGTYVSTLLTDSSGVVQGTLFYGGYRIEIVAKGFYPAQKDLILNKDTELTVTLQPQLLTVIMRYAIVIIAVCIAVVAIVAILKIKAKIVERLPKEELF